jgi:putative transposase
MARKRYSDEDVLKLLREIDVHVHDGLDVVSACPWICAILRSF